MNYSLSHSHLILYKIFDENENKVGFKTGLSTFLHYNFENSISQFVILRWLVTNQTFNQTENCIRNTYIRMIIFYLPKSIHSPAKRFVENVR